MNEGRTSVALFIPSFRGGGAEKMMVLLANELALRLGSVDLVVSEATGVFASQVGSSVRVVDLGTRRVVHSILPLARYLRTAAPTVMLTALDRANVVGIIAGTVSGGKTKVIISQRSNLSKSVENYRDFTSRVLYQMVPRLYKCADAVVGISRGVSLDLMENWGIAADKVHTIYNPVIRDWAHEGNEQTKGRSQSVDAERPIVLSVGRLTRAKDFGTLIRAYGHLRQRTNARLVILGEGELRAELESLVVKLGLEHDVSMPGFTSDPLSWMRRASVFVLSSAWEGFGNVLVEAMSCGVPVVSTDCPSGPAEILEGGKWGRLVPVGDHERLARAILSALQEPQTVDVRSRAKDFTTEIAATKYLQLIMKVAGSRGNPA